MAMVASMARQPFGALDGSRLSKLSNVKNVQNALPTTRPSLKRPYEPSQFDELENVDPELFSPTKKNKTGAQNFVQPFKAPLFSLNTMSRPIKAAKSPAARALGNKTPNLHIETPSAIGKRKSTDTILPGDGNSSKMRHVESAPVIPAGRSPKSKRIGILSRRRTRINPPSFSSSNGLPFSIDAAISGTVSSLKKKTTLDGSTPNGWMFDIHEDTPDQEMDNALQHSTCILDISDDEGLANGKANKGKENIPPPDDVNQLASTPNTNAVPVSRKNMMFDEPRTPLGDLNAEEFYAEGCDANSFIVIPAENLEKSDMEKALADTPTSQSGADAAYELGDGWKNLIAEVKAKQATAVTSLSEDVPNDGSPEIEIWESESAKGEDEAQIENIESTLALASGEEPLTQI